MRRTSMIAGALMVAVGLIAAGCGSSNANAGGGSGELSVTIGVPLPLTGSQASVGQTMLNGAKLAAAQAKGIKVKIVAEDTACDPQQGVNAANLLASQGVTAIAGYYCSGAALPSITIYHRKDIPTMITGAIDTQITQMGYPQIFRSIGTDLQEAQAAANLMANTLHYTKVAIISDHSAFGVQEATSTQQLLQKDGVSIVLDTAISTGQTDFGAVVSQLNSDGAQAVWFTGYFPEGGLLAKQLAASGSKVQFIGADSNLDPHFISIAGTSVAEKAIITAEPVSTQTPSAQPFIAAYQKMFNSPPGPYSSYQYSGTKALILAIKAANSTQPAKIIAALHKVSFQGPTSQISFAKDGQLKISDYVPMVIKNGQFVVRTSSN